MGRKIDSILERAYAIILAGGNGERFWPVSTPERPKQFVTLFGGKALIRQAVDRLEGVILPERTFVVTSARLVELTRATLPMIPAENVIGEPMRRDTAAAVAVACGLVKKHGGPDAVGCVLTADQIMKPVGKFKQVLKDCISAAANTDSIVTMGIVPYFPATGFGYIEFYDEIKLGTKTVFCDVRRFVEKPDAKTAARYVSSKRFLWNAGMFIWRASVLQRAFMLKAADIGALIDAVSGARNIPATLKRAYPRLRAISFDYAVMEKCWEILVARSEFDWDDVGTWNALSGHFTPDECGNTCLGRTATLDTDKSIIVSEGDHLVATLGIRDLVVVHTDKATLVCAKDRVQDIKKLLKTIPG